MSKYSTPFAIFGHAARIEILSLLQSGVTTVTALSDKVGLSSPEISRHLSQLQGLYLVEKTPDRTFEITSFGLLSWDLFQPLRFVLGHHEFFSRHRLDLLDTKLQMSVHLLERAELVEGTGLVMLQMQQVMERTQEIIKVMVDQPFPFGKQDIHVRYIVPPAEHFDPRRVKELHLKSVDARFVDPLPVACAIRDQVEGLLFFPDLRGNLDYSSVYRIDDLEVIKWLEAIWQHYWETGSSPVIS